MFQRKLKTIGLAFSLLFVMGCALKAIPSEYNFVKSDIENIELDKLGNGKVLIYNGADILHKIDNTARLNVYINNKPLGQVRPREYVVLDLKKGKYFFKLRHIDVVNMRSEHEIEIDQFTKVIRIEPTITSNKLTVTDELPKKFEKFKYMLSR